MQCNESMHDCTNGHIAPTTVANVAAKTCYYSIREISKQTNYTTRPHHPYIIWRATATFSDTMRQRQTHLADGVSDRQLVQFLRVFYAKMTLRSS